MANTYNLSQASAAADISGHRVFSVRSRRDQVEPGEGFNFGRADNLSRAFSLESLQYFRTTKVEREAIHRSLSDTLLTYSDDLKESISLCVGQPNGVFSRLRLFALPNHVGPVRKVVAKNYSPDGRFHSYKPIFDRVRKSIYSFWVMPVDGIWVLLVMHLVNYDVDDPDGAMDVSRKDGQPIIARFVRLYDVVLEGRVERQQKILERLPVVLKEGDIDCLDVPGKCPVFMSQDRIPILQNRSHDSGLLIHMIVEHLLERLEGIIQDCKNPARGTIRRRLHNVYEKPLWEPIRLPTNPGVLYRARGRMIGNLITGMSVTNQWQAMAAIEVPYCTTRAPGSLTSALGGLSIADYAQGDGDESLI
ncbi:hypothetical protein K445DRAFT_311938 [Daldinia sp. EC12]|nr:hypothetical protein F4774DRAFT_428135 [Daldinia eschscholtzii]OTB16653.1 hypothetical protein K445DRAFT_311938 [Daldinia sp. EC12]